MKKSAGILVYRHTGSHYEVLLAHPGGPFWAKKDEHSWSIPKGEFTDNEEAFDAALREFKEETGHEITGNFTELTPVRQSDGKVIYIWAVEGDLDASKITSNTFDLEWPPKSGIIQNIPEIDKAAWFSFDKATGKIFKGQKPIILELAEKLGISLA